MIELIWYVKMAEMSKYKAHDNVYHKFYKKIVVNYKNLIKFYVFYKFKYF